MTLSRALALADRRPHDFTIQYPPGRAFFQERYRAPLDAAVPSRPRRLLLYVHVPFCEARCTYCNFAVDLRRDEALHRRYVDGLTAALERLPSLLHPEAVVAGIDIGGGTPTRLSADLLGRLLAALGPWRRRSDHSWPLSVETTPRIAAAHPARLDALARGGVDRVSMGVQTTHEETLLQVNRPGQRSLAAEAAHELRRAGFRRVNVDLIFGLPGQTAAHWRLDLERVLEMGVDSLTVYDCLYRGQGRLLHRNAPAPPKPDFLGELYDLAYERLTAAGFHAAYGSVNFSRHAGETGTSPYFEGRLLDGLPYVGVGNYAASLVDPYWWFAPYRVNDWLRAVEGGDPLPAGDAYLLPVAERMAKHLLLSLNFGVLDAARFRARFGVGLADSFGPALDLAVARRWLLAAEGGFAVAPGAFGRLPWLRSLFYSAAALDWLQRREARRDLLGLQLTDSCS